MKLKRNFSMCLAVLFAVVSLGSNAYGKGEIDNFKDLNINYKTQSNNNEKIEIKDEVLRHEIMHVLGKNDNDDLLMSDTSKITTLYLEYKNVKNLEGIEYLTNLIQLNLSNVNVDDMTPIGSLLNLRKLTLRESNIKSLKFLENLTKLTDLDLSNNKIEDVNEFNYLTGLCNLKELDLQATGIKNIEVLSGMNKLTGLGINGNKIEDISPISKLYNLEGISLCDSNIKDISPLKKLKHLEGVDLLHNEPALYIEGTDSFNTINYLRERGTIVITDSLLAELQLPDITLSKSDIKEDKLVFEVPISIDKNKIKDIEAFQLKIAYDKNLLDFIEVKNGEILKNHDNVEYKIDKSGDIRILFNDKYTPNNPIRENGELVRLIFQVKDVKNEFYTEIRFNSDYSNYKCDFIDEHMQFVDSGHRNGRVRLVNGVLPQSIVLNEKKVKLKVGESFKLTATVLPENATNKKIKWVSSNESVAKVDNDGNVTAISLGKAIVTAVSEMGTAEKSCFINVCNEVPSKDEIVKFKDDNLKKAILKSINKDPNSELLLSEAKNIESLTIGGDSMVSNLEGIEKLTSLTWLKIIGGEIEDISPIRSLVNLKYLDLFGNKIKNLNGVEGLKNLTYIDFSYNEIKDLKPLQNLNNLGTIIGRNNNITDLSPCIKMTNLKTLILHSNNLLYMEGNKNYKDIECLKDKGILVEVDGNMIWLKYNNINLNSIDIKKDDFIFEIPIEVYNVNVNKIVDFNLEMQYDKNNLEFIEIKNGAMLNEGYNIEYKFQGEETKIVLKADKDRHNLILNDGELFKLVFKIKDPKKSFDASCIRLSDNSFIDLKGRVTHKVGSYSNCIGFNSSKDGDLNKDGVVDEKDLEVLSNRILNSDSIQYQSEEFYNLDINCDGSIDSLDYVLLKKLINEVKVEN